MSYQLLFNELAKYPGATDSEISEALNVETVVSKLAKTSEIIALAYNIGLYPQLVAVSLDDQYPVNLRAMAKSLLDLNTGNMPELDPFAPAAQSMLDGLRAANLITQEQRGQFEALGIASRTNRAAQLGFAEGVTVEDIATARTWVEAQADRDAKAGRLASFYNAALWAIQNDVPVPTWAEIVAKLEAA